MNVRETLHCGLIYPFWHKESMYGDRMQRHSIDEYLPVKKGCKIHGGVRTSGFMWT
jgi:hypothetical protein